ncbi:hypothetical protein BD309DRAFT_356250 [Dichomitus squalens]|nr:hypothetical protein BD309DRAFT_356250 [Dichomitus squalens]
MSHNSIFKLDVDVLVYMFQILQSAGGLRSLSSTCRGLRTLSMPVLFKICIVDVSRPITIFHFLPSTLWPFVSSLHIVDNCPDIRAMRLPKHDLHYTADPLMCGILDGAFLKDALQQMPRLRSVHVGFHWGEDHGLGWNVVDAILSASQIREFTISSYMFCPREAPARRDIPLNPSARLTTFNYARYASRSQLHADVQRAALGVVVGSLRFYLERLRLPSDLSPISTLRSLSWTRLRELRLDGTYPPNIDAPLLDIISGMPRLRSLALLFALPRDMEKQPLWPPRCTLHFPLPELEELVVSYPDPEDYLYSHLPPSLRRLSLRCCPHHCVHAWEPEYCSRWHSPIPCASDLLRILSSIKTPLLQHLQLEYVADHADAALLGNISASFPRLSSLEIHRFRQADNSDVSIEDVTLAIAHLHHLRTISLHLDLPDIPGPSYSVRRGVYYFSGQDIVSQRKVLTVHATALAHAFGRSGYDIRLMGRGDTGGEWHLFHISEGEGPQSLRVDFDSGHREVVSVGVFDTSWRT